MNEFILSFERAVSIKILTGVLLVHHFFSFDTRAFYSQERSLSQEVFHNLILVS